MSQWQNVFEVGETLLHKATRCSQDAPSFLIHSIRARAHKYKKSRGTMHGDGAGGRAGQLWYNAGMIQRGGSDGRTYNPKKEAERERERERR
jgi:hypothetical protein